MSLFGGPVVGPPHTPQSSCLGLAKPRHLSSYPMGLEEPHSTQLPIQVDEDEDAEAGEDFKNFDLEKDFKHVDLDLNLLVGRD